jgi:UDP-N-acetylglucosamine--N-acetylmuramyl-(pentapeptide) pyrophosphoryl-undecaprenol N-acetylglucosamine transferase
MIMNEECIVFTGGGTAGHVFPGLAIIGSLSGRWEGSIAWVGSSNGMEKDIVESEDIPFYGIRSGKLRRYFSFRNFSDIINIIAGFFMAFRLLSRLKPVALFSKGGYVSVPVVIAARILGIYTLTHESDYSPGLANRINSHFVHHILVSFEGTRNFFPPKVRNKVIVSGNPVREELSSGSRERARTRLQLSDSLPVLLVLGGSQGARQINQLIGDVNIRLYQRCYIIHQMGKLEYQPSGNDHYITFPFIGAELRDFFAVADIVVSRAGANTLWEIGKLGKPSVLIPLTGSATRGDQVKNAEQFAQEGAAIVLNNQDVTAENLYRTLEFLLDHPEERKQMGARAAQICARDANQIITNLLIGG